MKTLAHIADSHFCAADPRFAECVKLHDWIADDVEKRKPDVIVHAGDLHDRKSVPEDRNAAARWLIRCAAIAPVVIVRGNHDVVGDLAIYSKLATKHPILVEEACGVKVVGGVAIGCLAWPRKAELLARAGQVSPDDGNQLAGDALRNVLRGLGDQMREWDGPHVLLAHAMVRGSTTSSGQPLVGCDMEIGIEDLALADADYIALGHIHKAQDWTFDGAPIVYPGAPRRTAFGEVEEKGYVLAKLEVDHFNEHKNVRWERIVAPTTPMLLVEGEWCGAGLNSVGDRHDVNDILFGSALPDAAGAEVRLRYYVENSERDAARARATDLRDQLLGAGAVSVKVEEVVRSTTRARTPEIVTAKSLPDKLRVLWGAKKIAIDNERERRVFAKLAELEAA